MGLKSQDLAISLALEALSYIKTLYKTSTNLHHVKHCYFDFVDGYSKDYLQVCNFSPLQDQE